jgi:hypothetical protein
MPDVPSFKPTCVTSVQLSHNGHGSDTATTFGRSNLTTRRISSSAVASSDLRVRSGVRKFLQIAGGKGRGIALRAIEYLTETLPNIFLTEDVVRNVMHPLLSDDADCDAAIRHLEAGRLTVEVDYVPNEVDDSGAGIFVLGSGWWRRHRATVWS